MIENNYTQVHCVYDLYCMMINILYIIPNIHKLPPLLLNISYNISLLVAGMTQQANAIIAFANTIYYLVIPSKNAD